jgi:quinol monooxygenase YgiN
MDTNYLSSVIKQFEYYKNLGEKTFTQIPDEKLFWQYKEDSNSIATIVKHLWGNMISRWTDFLTADGEKDWRNRDAEFENDLSSKQEVIGKWNEGWIVFLGALKSLKEEDLGKIVYIRHQGHTILEAINRQLSHYSYHIGQIVFIGKMVAEKWDSLSIPKGKSKTYNLEKFSKPKEKGHFTDEYLYQEDKNHHVLIIHEVGDYPKWKNIFDNAVGIRKEAGEISYQVLRFELESKRIVHFSRWNSLENAKKFFESPKLVQIRIDAGVKSPEFIYLEEVEKKTL